MSEKTLLPPGSLVIADLHLDVERAQDVERFEAWLAAEAPARLIVLGDLFEYWIGPAQAETPGGRRVLAALATLVRRGTRVDVIPGNRDFLLDARFERASGCRVRPDGLVGALPGGRRVLFVHGDELSTLDHAYQRLRSVLRSAPVRWLAQHVPAFLARATARRLRRASRRAVAKKPRDVAALQESACRALAATHAAQLLVCGHAHRFRDEELPGGPRWLVLDAFGGRRDTLVVDPAGELVARPGAAELDPGAERV